MIDTKQPASMRERPSFNVNPVLFKASIAILVCLQTVQMAPVLGPIVTFIGLDLILSVYLTSLFRGNYRYLFLIHPVFVLISSYGFQIPYTDIGVGYSYLNTFDKYIDPSTMALESNLLIEQLIHGRGAFGLGVVYVGSIPILYLPSFLFPDPPDIAVYFSLSVFTMLYAAIAASVALFFRVIRTDVLLVIALFATVSPIFLEINSGLHRYGLLLLGLFLFLIAYVGLTRKRICFQSLSLSLVMLLSIVFVAVSKTALLLSLALFVVLDRFSRNKLPLLSAKHIRLDKTTYWATIAMGITIAQYLANFVLPAKYVLGDSQSGGEYPGLINVPILGLAVRLIYATLSPFPWLNFSQYELYGFNSIFLWLHIFSALSASWIILSLFARLRLIVKGDDDIRVTAMFGIAVMSSLAFSGIGYHVYLAPALPFLATILLEKRNRVHLVYPIGFCAVMEVVAQATRFIR